MSREITTPWLRHLLELVEHEELRRQLGARARLTIENHWTWDIQGARLAHVLQLAWESRRGARRERLHAG